MRLILSFFIWTLLLGVKNYAIDRTDRNLFLNLSPEFIHNLIGDKKNPEDLEILKTFYAHEPRPSIWYTDQLELRGESKDWVAILNDAYSEGFPTGSFHVDRLRVLFSKKNLCIEECSELEILLSDAVVSYARALKTGYLEKVEDDDWHMARKTFDSKKLLEDLQNHTDPQTILNEIKPTHPVYERLKTLLAKYESFVEKGDWEKLEVLPKALSQYTNEEKQRIHKRLSDEGYLPQDNKEANLDLQEPLCRFQRSVGKECQTKIDQDLLNDLNIGAKKRVRQIKANLERWRWTPWSESAPVIIVNIPNFMLYVLKKGEVFSSMKVVIGKESRPTPIFSAQMTQVQFNPMWVVPKKIATEDILPEIQRTPRYLIKRHIRVFQTNQKDLVEVNPWKVRWSKYSTDYFPFRLVQDPGQDNALGRAKFILPNSFGIYLHDTPARDLFSKSRRSFSSGCVRLEKPLDLAGFVLQGEKSIPDLQALIDTDQTLTFALPHQIPVYFSYWTVWVTEKGEGRFYQDIYDKDAYYEIN